MTRLTALSSALCLALLGVSPARAAAEPSDIPTIEAGYHDMYNLDFDSAHKVFRGWEQAHPNDPLAPASDAAAYLFSEFDRLHILQAELFTDNDAFQNRQKPAPDPSVKAAFESSLSQSEHMADQVLVRSPQDANALFAKVLASGLRGDYIALIEKRDLASLSYMKQGRERAEKLVAVDPSCYDAYVAVGVENYILGAKPAAVRFFLRLSGAQTDKEAGISKLRLAADKGHFLAPFARLLLAVAALRDKDHNTARSLLAALAHEFPRNILYRNELARINP